MTNNKIITTNIRIPAGELLTYREWALSQGKSFSQLVREVLAQTIIPSSVRTKHLPKKRDFWDIDKQAVKSGDPMASQKIDQYIYGL